MIEKDKIIFQESISVKKFCELRERVGFQALTQQQAQRVLENTSFLLNAVYNGDTVGLLRILTDMGTDAYITDVIVHQDQKYGFQKLPNDKYGYGMLIELQVKWKAFGALKDNPELFFSMEVDTGGHGIIWNDDLDLSCEELIKNGETIKTPFDGVMAPNN